MSLEVIRKVLLEAIQNPTPEVIAIKGKWGTGKTYFWNEFIKENKGKISNVYEYYSYVSTFGITSLNKLKTEIYVKAIKPKVIGDEIKLTPNSLKKNWKQHLKSLIPFLQNTKLAGKVEDINISLDSSSDMFNALMNATFKSTLIVIDDLERLSKGIDYSDLLGFISQLKNEKKCKIIIILNDEEIEGDYHKIKEKIIDKEIEFKLGAEEKFSLLFDNEFEFLEDLKNSINLLSITNLRTLQKIKNNYCIIKEELNQLTKQDTKDTIKKLVLLTYCYYENNKDTPTLEEIENYNALDDLFTDDKEPIENKVEIIFRTSDINFFGTGGIQIKTLATIIKQGYKEGSSIKTETTELSLRRANEEKINQYTKHIRKFFYDFSINIDDWSEELVRLSLETIKNISLADLNFIASILSKLGKGDLVKTIITEYIDVNKNNQRAFNLSDIIQFGEEPCVILKESFLNIEFANHGKTAQEALLYISNNNGWNEDDEIAIQQATEEDLYNIFKAPNIELENSLLLAYQKFEKHNPQMPKLKEKKRAALIRIGKEGTNLTKLQLEKYGITEIDYK